MTVLQSDGLTICWYDNLPVGKSDSLIVIMYYKLNVGIASKDWDLLNFLFSPFKMCLGLKFVLILSFLY